MKFYFDESGDFRLDGDGADQVGIVVGITVPENAETKVFDRFDEFVATLPATAFKKGEPKGSLLTAAQRSQFAKMIAENRNIVVTPTIVDIRSIIRSQKHLRLAMVRRMRDLAEKCIHSTMRQQMHLLASQFKNLSDNQSLRMSTVTYCMKRAFEQTIILLSGTDYYHCWEQMRFEVDPVDVRRGGREELVFKWTMLGWLQGWTLKEPIMTITEIHTENHPLIRGYSNENDKFDLKKLFGNNLHYPRSSDSKGLQMADMAASILRHAMCGIITLENLMNYGLLLKNNLWAPRFCHGLVCFGDPAEVDLRIYEGLTEAVAKVRGGKAWAEIVRHRLGLVG